MCPIHKKGLLGLWIVDVNREIKATITLKKETTEIALKIRWQFIKTTLALGWGGVGLNTSYSMSSMPLGKHVKKLVVNDWCNKENKKSNAF